MGSKNCGPYAACNAQRVKTLLAASSLNRGMSKKASRARLLSDRLHPRQGHLSCGGNTQASVAGSGSIPSSAKRVPFICLQVRVSSSDGLAAGLAAGLGVGRRCVGGGPSRGGPASRIDQFASSRKFLHILGQLLDAKVWLPWPMGPNQACRTMRPSIIREATIEKGRGNQSNL